MKQINYYDVFSELGANTYCLRWKIISKFSFYFSFSLLCKATLCPMYREYNKALVTCWRRVLSTAESTSSVDSD